MVEKVKKSIKSECGAVQIVEATFVFPVMFIVLFFLIFMGNAHYVKAQIESVVETYAIRGANYCADPILQTIHDNGTLPDLSALETEPYRYIFGGMGDVETQIAAKVREEIEGNQSSFFKNMKPRLKSADSQIAKYNNYVVYATFSVEVEYDLQFPIRFLGAHSPTTLNIKSRADVPVDDTAEFIRNTDMVVDIFHGTKLGQSISDVFGKVNDFINSFASK